MEPGEPSDIAASKPGDPALSDGELEELLGWELSAVPDRGDEPLGFAPPSRAEGAPPALLAPPLAHDLSPLREEEQLGGLVGGAVVYYRPGFLDREVASTCFGALLPGGAAAVRWERRTIKMFGREVYEKHDTAHYGDPGTTYKYSGKVHDASDWEADPTGALAALRDLARIVGGVPYNYCLCNLYAAEDSIGAHSDDESDLIAGSSIFSVSLGRVRLFQMDPKGGEGAGGQHVALRLAHGSALVMAGATQRAYKHYVKAEKRRANESGPALRVNLTFRCVRPKRR